MGWRQVTLNENPDASLRPREIQVGLNGGARIWVRSPAVRGDTLYGLTVVSKDPITGKAVQTQKASIPLSIIDFARVSRVDAARTAVIVALVPVVLVGLFLLFGGPTIAPEF